MPVGLRLRRSPRGSFRRLRVGLPLSGRSSQAVRAASAWFCVAFGIGSCEGLLPLLQPSKFQMQIAKCCPGCQYHPDSPAQIRSLVKLLLRLSRTH